MGLFKKKNKVIEVGGQKIELQPKPKKGVFALFSKKGAQKPAPKSVSSQPASQLFTPTQPQAPRAPEPQMPKSTVQMQPEQKQPQQMNKIEADYGRPQPRPQATVQKPKQGLFSRFGSKSVLKPGGAAKAETPRLEFPSAIAEGSRVQAIPGQPAARGQYAKPKGKQSPLDKYIEKTAAKQKGLEAALREAGMKSDVISFVKRMFFASVALSIVLAIVVFVFFSAIGLTAIEAVLFAVVLGIGIFQTSQKSFLQYPLAREKSTAKNVERDILFAARDLIISLRSGMPLFNALTSVSTGYGDASKEFAKIVDRVQLGMPLEDAIDDTIASTKSASFRRIMLQASVSIKAGADVVSALQSIIEQLSQERIIELRSYGQKLNAIAMFYMLFGVILPSMGIAVITILTTFIALFTVDTTVFEFVLIGIIGLQVIFLRLITGSRPVFSM